MASRLQAMAEQRVARYASAVMGIRCTSVVVKVAALTRPLGSASGGIGPKWSFGTFTMILPLAAFALPALTALSVVYASSGLSLSLIRSVALLLEGSCTPCLAIRMAVVRAVLILGLPANLAGKELRQVGHVFLPCATHFLKQARQKLC